MKRFCAILVPIIITCLATFNSFAQKRNLDTKLQKEEVEGVSREGTAINIDLNNKSIVKEWESLLKTYGKLSKLKGDAYKVIEANFPGVSGTCVIYAKCYSSSKGYVAWLSIDNGTEITANSKQAESKLQEFARQQYINDVNTQIKDAEDALKSATKGQEKQIDKGADLVKDISKNGQAKKKLEENLKENASDLVKLNKDVENNKIDQKKAAEEVAKMQKALDVVKAKLNGL
jgi:hypothetical protein